MALMFMQSHGVQSLPVVYYPGYYDLCVKTLSLAALMTLSPILGSGHLGDRIGLVAGDVPLSFRLVSQSQAKGSSRVPRWLCPIRFDAVARFSFLASPNLTPPRFI